MTSDAQILARPAATGEGADPRRWLTLIILLLAAFMNLLDVSIVNIAIPSIQRDLNASYADVQWALAGFGVTAGLGTVSGPLIGGLLIQHNLFGLGWRTIFLINVPIGVIAVVASAVLVRESRAPSPPRLDPVGVGLVSAALLLLLYPLVQGRQLGWPTWTFVSMAASAPLFALFVAWERVKERRDGSPLVPLRLFGERGFSAGMAVVMT